MINLLGIKNGAVWIKDGRFYHWINTNKFIIPVNKQNASLIKKFKEMQKKGKKVKFKCKGFNLNDRYIMKVEEDKKECWVHFC